MDIPVRQVVMQHADLVAVYIAGPDACTPPLVP